MVFPRVEGEERILSAQKRKRRAWQTASEMAIFVYMQSSKLGCFRRILVKNGTRRILVKNGTQINSPIVASVEVITSLGKHVFSEEFI